MSEPRARRRRGITRRAAIAGVGVAGLASASTAAYAVGVETQLLDVTRYRLALPRWQGGPTLRIAILADIHACEPWMSAERVRGIVAETNGLAPDITLLLGDYVSNTLRFSRDIPPEAWAAELRELQAPLGVHAVLGNHDWADREIARRTGVPPARIALEAVGIPVYENEARRIMAADGRAFWLAGLGDQMARIPWRRRKEFGGREFGVDDLGRTMAAIPEGAPAILMAHEPDIFPDVPEHIALTLSGHTHGGQVRIFGHAPVVPSHYGERYAYGHVREHTDLVVSGGLGCSHLPVRLGVPPEIVLIELSDEATA